MRKTKIIATLGPRWSNYETTMKLIEEGVDVCRLNFSFGTHEEHLEQINLIRAASKKLEKPVAILADLQGPKIRVGTLKSPKSVTSGEVVHLSGYSHTDDDNVIPTTHENIASDSQQGSMLLIADGTIQLIVISSNIEMRLVECKVITGGTILSGKGINLPGAHVTTEVLTEKDQSDARFAAENGVDYLGMSFVRTANDILRLRKMLEKWARTNVKIISKIENTESLENLESIIKESDGIMVARGDLGVEIPFAEVPIQQKKILKLTNELGKISIIATQMLESMTKSPVPSRAEASDVANSVFDGTDVVMMSAETASGDYPIESVKAMVSIVMAAEKEIALRGVDFEKVNLTTHITEALAESTAHLSFCIGHKVIIALSRSGKTVRALSKKRPKTPIVFFSASESDCSSLAICHNVYPIFMPENLKFDETITNVNNIDKLENELIKHGLANHKDMALVVSGSKWQGRWQENSIRIVVIQ